MQKKVESRRNLLLLIAVTGSLSACSSTDIAFRFADTAIVSKVDDYFNLSSEQRSSLKKHVSEDLNRIRKSKLPEIAKKLRTLAPITEKTKLSSPEVTDIYQQIQSALKELSSEFKQTSLKTVITFKSDQFETFKKKVLQDIDEDNDVKFQQKEALKRYRRSLEFWLGDISSEQKEKLEIFLKNNPYPTDLQLENRKFVMTKFVATQESLQEREEFIQSFILDFDSHRLPEFKSALGIHRQKFIDFFTEEFWPSLDPDQKKSLKKNLLQRADEIEQLSKKP